VRFSYGPPAEEIERGLAILEELVTAATRTGAAQREIGG
jgi:hypothetical protein